MLNSNRVRNLFSKQAIQKAASCCIMTVGLSDEVNHVFPLPAKARLKKELPDSITKQVRGCHDPCRRRDQASLLFLSGFMTRLVFGFPQDPGGTAARRTQLL